jgi:hypothetical protein
MPALVAAAPSPDLAARPDKATRSNRTTKKPTRSNRSNHITNKPTRSSRTMPDKCTRGRTTLDKFTRSRTTLDKLTRPRIVDYTTMPPHTVGMCPAISTAGSAGRDLRQASCDVVKPLIPSCASAACA